MASLKLGSFNVGDFHSSAKQNQNLAISEKIADRHSQIAYLQETHLLMPEVEKLNGLGRRVLAAAPFTPKARGVVILVRASLTPTLHSAIVNPQGRYIRSDATIGQSKFNLYNLSAPNSYSKDFFLHILNKLYQLRNKPILL